MLGSLAAGAAARPKLVIIGVLVLALVIVGWLYRQEIQNAARQAYKVTQLAGTVESLDESVQELKKERAILVRAIQKQTQMLKSIRKNRESLRRDIERLKEVNNATRRWAGNPIPDPIRGLLRKAGSDQNGTGVFDAAH